jgi:hypothetical protein
VEYEIIFKVFYSPTDAQEFCFKRNIKIYIKNAGESKSSKGVNPV